MTMHCTASAARHDVGSMGTAREAGEGITVRAAAGSARASCNASDAQQERVRIRGGAAVNISANGSDGEKGGRRREWA